MLGLFGDVLFRTPILRSIKKKFPNSEITVIVDKIGYYVLYNNPNVNNLTIINRNKKNRLNYVWNKIKTQFKIIFSRFDLVVDLYNGSSSRNMARLSFSKFFIATDDGGGVSRITTLVTKRTTRISFLIRSTDLTWIGKA